MIRAGWLAVLALGLVATPATAQTRGGLVGGWGGVELLLNPAVQRELKLDADQVAKARAVVVEMRDRQKGLFASLEGLEGEERTRKSQELASAHVEEGLKALGAFLGPEQLARYRQVDLQQRGAVALTDPQVVRALRISPEQVERIKPILNNSVLLLREAATNTRGNRRLTTEKIQAIRKETDARAVALLDDDQRAAWNSMIGEAFDINAPSR